MKLKRSAVSRLLVLLLLYLNFNVGAQPVLPDIAGATENGIVLLSWVCQYDGVKAIAVRRSADSVFNFKIVGYVKNTKKGVQAFVDGHPQAGNNFYKLNIVFNSGLNWSSNHYRVIVDSADLTSKTVALPPNDSLQQYTITEGAKDAATSTGNTIKHSTDDTTHSGKNMVLAFDIPATDTALTDTLPTEPTVMKRRIVLSFPRPDIDEATFIKSMFLSVNRLTGHLEIRLPDEAKGHVFSIKFYNKQGREMLEIPEIKARFVVVDKRNFQRKGLYKFVLKKDGVVFETAYIEITM